MRSLGFCGQIDFGPPGPDLVWSCVLLAQHSPWLSILTRDLCIAQRPEVGFISKVFPWIRQLLKGRSVGIRTSLPSYFVLQWLHNTFGYLCEFYLFCNSYATPNNVEQETKLPTVLLWEKLCSFSSSCIPLSKSSSSNATPLATHGETRSCSSFKGNSLDGGEPLRMGWRSSTWDRQPLGSLEFRVKAEANPHMPEWAGNNDCE